MTGLVAEAATQIATKSAARNAFENWGNALVSFDWETTRTLEFTWDFGVYCLSRLILRRDAVGRIDHSAEALIGLVGPDNCSVIFAPFRRQEILKAMTPAFFRLVPNSIRPAMRWARALAMRLSRESRAVAAIEFAFIAPALILLIVEALQIGFFFYTSAALNAATNYAARQIRIGAVTTGNMTAPQFQAYLCTDLPATMTCPGSVIVNVYDVTEAIGAGNGFNAFLNTNQTAVAQPSPMISGTFCPGSAGGTIYVQTYYAMPLISPIWMAFAAKNGQNWNGGLVHFVAASAVFKSEPFGGGQDTMAAC
jgi:Flp pilus assembly protein TadG